MNDSFCISHILRWSNRGFILFVFLGFVGRPASALDEFKPLFRGVRAQAMGNAFTAIADDEQAIFFNPAGLAGVKGFSLNVLSLNAEASKDLIENTATLKDSLANPGLSTVNSMIGKNMYGRLQGSSSLVMPRFGFAAFADSQLAMRLNNLSMPSGMYGVQNTYGFQAAFGMPIYKFKKKRGELRFGLAGKLLWRAGGFVNPTVTNIMTFDTASLQGNMTQFGRGIGLDAGLQYVRTIKKKFTLMAGLAITDIGDTYFQNGGDPQLSRFTGGVAGSYKSADVKVTLAMDYSNILTAMDWRKQMHLGMELKFPILSLYTGLSSMQPSFGGGIDIGLFKLMYVSYAEELSYLAGQDPERRQLVSFSFKLDP